MTCIHCLQHIPHRFGKKGYCNDTCRDLAMDAAAKRKADLVALTKWMSNQRKRIRKRLEAPAVKLRDDQLGDTFAVIVRGRV